MNKIYYILVIIICISIILIGTNQKVRNKDAERFAVEYIEVSKDNIFVYEPINNIIEIIKNNTGIIYLGYPECTWCQTYVKYLNEIAKQMKVEKILYCNIRKLKRNDKENYSKIVELIKEHLPYEVDEENPMLYVPNIVFVKNGKIIGNENTTAKDTEDISEPKEFWNRQRILELKQTLTKYIKEVNN